MDILTIFTATFNRCELLPRLYESLKKQTTKNFEWIVIDDGSTDDTADYMMRIASIEDTFSIRFVRQPHGGKHRALNAGFDLAKGEFFFPVDSDDYLLDDAVEKINTWIDSIKDNRDFIGVSGLKITESEIVIGGNPNINRGEYIDASVFERNKYGLMGDKAEIWRTSACKRNKFPEFDGEYFLTEAVCWEAISANGEKVRWFNEPIYVCEYLDDGLTKSGANDLKGHIENYKGYCYYIRQSLRFRTGEEWARLIYSYYRESKKMGVGIATQAEKVNVAIMKYVLDLLMAILLLAFIKIRKMA